MAKAIFFLLLVVPLFNAAYGDKRLQNLNLDFLNFEGQNRKQLPTSPQPLPTAQKNLDVTTSTTTAKSTIQNQPGEPLKPNQAATTSTTLRTPPKVPPKPNVAPASVPTSNPAPVTQNKNLPIPPRTGPQPIPTTNPGASWASIAAGKGPSGGSKPAVPPTGNIGAPSSPTQLKPQPKYPTVAPHVSPKTTPKPGDAKTTAAPELATDKELSDMSEALLGKDVNNPAKYVTLNSQRKTTSFSKDDVAPDPLFTINSAVWNIPTVAAMRTLLDNYEQDTTVNEYVTAQEKTEENAFLDAVMATSVMRHLMTFLKEKGIVTPDPKQQRDVLKQTWFNMYSRGGGKISSSGFEHIFLSEIKNNEISGLHNWLYFHTQETARNANYLGYLKIVDISNKGNIMKLHFSLKGIDKPVDSMFVGTSPELEMALYSLCFYTRADKACPLTLGGQKFNLRTHTFRYRSKNMIGSAFPEI